MQGPLLGRGCGNPEPALDFRPHFEFNFGKAASGIEFVAVLHDWLERDGLHADV